MRTNKPPQFLPFFREFDWAESELDMKKMETNKCIIARPGQGVTTRAMGIAYL
jgi:hypothetical protein